MVIAAGLKTAAELGVIGQVPIEGEAEPLPKPAVVALEGLCVASSAPQVAYRVCPMAALPAYSAKIERCLAGWDMRKTSATVPTSLKVSRSCGLAGWKLVNPAAN